MAMMYKTDRHLSFLETSASAVRYIDIAIIFNTIIVSNFDITVADPDNL